MRSRLAKSLIVTVCLGMMAGGFWLRGVQMDAQARQREAERADKVRQSFLTQLANDPLFTVDGDACVRAKGSHVRGYLAYAAEQNIDLLHCYRNAAKDTPLRVSAALLLISANDARYFQLLQRPGANPPPEEVMLWVDLVHHPPTPALPAETARTLAKLATASPTPPGLWFAAQRYLQAALPDRAEPLLLKLLQTPSQHGLAAADRLLQENRPSLRTPATEYLWNLARDEASPLRRDAILRLVLLYGAARSPEYRRYSVLDTPETAEALLRKLAAMRLPGSTSHPATAPADVAATG